MEPVVANLSTIVDYYNRLVIIVTISESCLWLSAFGARILVIPLATGFANGPAREIAMETVLVHVLVKLVLQGVPDALDHALDPVQVELAKLTVLDAQVIVQEVVIQLVPLHVLTIVLTDAKVNAPDVRTTVLEVVDQVVLDAIHPVN